jgi:hypothetical protein
LKLNRFKEIRELLRQNTHSPAKSAMQRQRNRQFVERDEGANALMQPVPDILRPRLYTVLDNFDFEEDTLP